MQKLIFTALITDTYPSASVNYERNFYSLIVHLGTPRPFFYFWRVLTKKFRRILNLLYPEFFCQAVMSSISAFKKGLRWAQWRPLRPYSVHHFIPDIHVWESFLPITNFILMSEIYCVFLLFLQQQQTSLTDCIIEFINL